MGPAGGVSGAWRGAAGDVRAWWARNGEWVLRAAVLAMVAGAAWRLSNELPHLLFDADGAHDLRLRHYEVPRWFAGLQVYGGAERGDYPPASYVILWPLVGWLPLAATRWLWAVTALLALGGLSWMGMRAVSGATTAGRLVVGLLPFSVYASSATLSIGQLVNHVLPVLLGGLLLLRRSDGSLRADLVACALLVTALVKPPLVVPFFWIVCFVPGRWRPIVLVTAGYAALTLLAVSFAEGPLWSTLFGWVVEAPQPRVGHTNVHRWLALAGLGSWTLAASLAILLGLAVWVFRHRRVDVWVLLGVSAIVAQLWIHHRLYDHLLILVSMIPLFRIAMDGAREDGADVLAGGLFVLTWLTLHAPATLLIHESRWSGPLEAWQAAVWLSVLAFLVLRAREGRTQGDMRGTS